MTVTFQASQSAETGSWTNRKLSASQSEEKSLEELISEELLNEVGLASTENYSWTCNREECDGMPHGNYDYRHARTEQQMPRGDDWRVLMIRAGRGWGKSRCAAELLCDLVIEYATDESGNPTTWLLASSTIADARDTGVQAPGTGLLACLDRRGIKYNYNRSLQIINFSTGQRILIRGGDDHDLARGTTLAGGWIDEFGLFNRAESAWREGLLPALRAQIPGGPKVIMTLTPKQRNLKLIQSIENAEGTIARRGATQDNAANLSDAMLEAIMEAYGSTESPLYRQEILAQFVSTSESLFQMESIEKHRYDTAQEFNRVIIAVDPSVGGSDLCGINVIGVSGTTRKTREYFVLADLSTNSGPEMWSKEVANAVRDYEADVVVFERNQGGQLTDLLLQKAFEDENVTACKIVSVHAKRGKMIRAELPASLTSSGRVHFPTEGTEQLEEQLVTWSPSDKKSPDRMDAFVYAVLEGHSAKSQLAGAF